MTETTAGEVQAGEVQQDPGHRIWHLNEDDIAPTIAKLERINTRAVKQGLTGRYSYRLGEEHREPVYDDEDARTVINDFPHLLECGPPVPFQLLHTKVTRELIVDMIS